MDYCEAGLRSDQAVIVVATLKHIADVRDRLNCWEFDLTDLCRLGRVTFIDGVELLEAISVEGDRNRLLEVMWNVGIECGQVHARVRHDCRAGRLCGDARADHRARRFALRATASENAPRARWRCHCKRAKS